MNASCKSSAPLRGKRGKEVPIPVYDRLHDDFRLMERMYDIVVDGVSTRRYDEVLPEMAHPAGISKSSVSRQLAKASKKKLVELMELRFEDRDILEICMVNGSGVALGDRAPSSATRPLPALLDSQDS